MSHLIAFRAKLRSQVFPFLSPPVFQATELLLFRKPRLEVTGPGTPACRLAALKTSGTTDALSGVGLQGSANRN